MIRRAGHGAKLLLNILMAGPSGYGKTSGALRLAAGLAGGYSGVVIIDTESRADFESPLGDFSVIDFEPPYTPERAIDKFSEALRSDASVIVLDTISSIWSDEGGVLEEVEILKSRESKPGRNTLGHWAVMTPRWGRLIRVLTSAPKHVIVTCRVEPKAEIIDGADDKKKVHMQNKLICKQGAQFWFLQHFFLYDKYVVTAETDRTRTLPPKFEPCEDIGAKLAAYCANVPVVPRPAPPPALVAPQAEEQPAPEFEDDQTGVAPATVVFANIRKGAYNANPGALYRAWKACLTRAKPAEATAMLAFLNRELPNGLADFLGADAVNDLLEQIKPRVRVGGILKPQGAINEP